MAAATVKSRHPGVQTDSFDPLENVLIESVNNNDNASVSMADEATPRLEKDDIPSNSGSAPSAYVQEVAAEPYVPMAMQVHQLGCDECDWHSLVVHDEGNIGQIVNQWEAHMRVKHGSQPSEKQAEVSSSQNQSDENSNDDEFKKATTPKEVPAHRDDRNRLLSPARWFPGGFNWQIQARAIPVSVEPVCSVIDLSHIGCSIYLPRVFFYVLGVMSLPKYFYC